MSSDGVLVDAMVCDGVDELIGAAAVESFAPDETTRGRVADEADDVETDWFVFDGDLAAPEDLRDVCGLDLAVDVEVFAAVVV